MELDALPASIVSTLHTVTLTGNRLAHLAGIGQFKACEFLSLANNRIEYFSELEHLRPLRKLLHLRLEGNPFMNAPHSRCRVITELDAMGIRLKSLDGILVTSQEREKSVDILRSYEASLSSCIVTEFRIWVLSHICKKLEMHEELLAILWGTTAHGASKFRGGNNFSIPLASKGTPYPSAFIVAPQKSPTPQVYTELLKSSTTRRRKSKNVRNPSASPEPEPRTTSKVISARRDLVLARKCLEARESRPWNMSLRSSSSSSGSSRLHPTSITETATTAAATLRSSSAPGAKDIHTSIHTSAAPAASSIAAVSKWDSHPGVSPRLHVAYTAEKRPDTKSITIWREGPSPPVPVAFSLPFLLQYRFELEIQQLPLDTSSSVYLSLRYRIEQLLITQFPLPHDLRPNPGTLSGDSISPVPPASSPSHPSKASPAVDSDVGVYENPDFGVSDLHYPVLAEIHAMAAADGYQQGFRTGQTQSSMRRGASVTTSRSNSRTKLGTATENVAADTSSFAKAQRLSGKLTFAPQTPELPPTARASSNQRSLMTPDSLSGPDQTTFSELMSTPDSSDTAAIPTAPLSAPLLPKSQDVSRISTVSGVTRVTIDPKPLAEAAGVENSYANSFQKRRIQRHTADRSVSRTACTSQSPPPASNTGVASGSLPPHPHAMTSSSSSISESAHWLQAMGQLTTQHSHILSELYQLIHDISTRTLRMLGERYTRYGVLRKYNLQSVHLQPQTIGSSSNRFLSTRSQSSIDQIPSASAAKRDITKAPLQRSASDARTHGVRQQTASAAPISSSDRPSSSATVRKETRVEKEPSPDSLLATRPYQDTRELVMHYSAPKSISPKHNSSVIKEASSSVGPAKRNTEMQVPAQTRMIEQPADVPFSSALKPPTNGLESYRNKAPYAASSPKQEMASSDPKNVLPAAQLIPLHSLDQSSVPCNPALSNEPVDSTKGSGPAQAEERIMDISEESNSSVGEKEDRNNFTGITETNPIVWDVTEIQQHFRTVDKLLAGLRLKIPHFCRERLDDVLPRAVAHALLNALPNGLGSTSPAAKVHASTRSRSTEKKADEDKIVPISEVAELMHSFAQEFSNKLGNLDSLLSSFSSTLTHSTPSSSSHPPPSITTPLTTDIDVKVTMTSEDGKADSIPPLKQFSPPAPPSMPPLDPPEDGFLDNLRKDIDALPLESLRTYVLSLAVRLHEFQMANTKNAEYFDEEVQQYKILLEEANEYVQELHMYAESVVKSAASALTRANTSSAKEKIHSFPPSIAYELLNKVQDGRMQLHFLQQHLLRNTADILDALTFTEAPSSSSGEKTPATSPEHSESFVEDLAVRLQTNLRSVLTSYLSDLDLNNKSERSNSERINESTLASLLEKLEEESSLCMGRLLTLTSALQAEKNKSANLGIQLKAASVEKEAYYNSLKSATQQKSECRSQMEALESTVSRLQRENYAFKAESQRWMEEAEYWAQEAEKERILSVKQQTLMEEGWKQGMKEALDAESAALNQLSRLEKERYSALETKHQSLQIRFDELQAKVHEMREEKRNLESKHKEHVETSDRKESLLMLRVQELEALVTMQENQIITAKEEAKRLSESLERATKEASEYKQLAMTSERNAFRLELALKDARYEKEVLEIDFRQQLSHVQGLHTQSTSTQLPPPRLPVSFELIKQHGEPAPFVPLMHPTRNIPFYPSPLATSSVLMPTSGSETKDLLPTQRASPGMESRTTQLPSMVSCLPLFSNVLSQQARIPKQDDSATTTQPLLGEVVDASTSEVPASAAPPTSLSAPEPDFWRAKGISSRKSKYFVPSVVSCALSSGSNSLPLPSLPSTLVIPTHDDIQYGSEDLGFSGATTPTLSDNESAFGGISIDKATVAAPVVVAKSRDESFATTIVPSSRHTFQTPSATITAQATELGSSEIEDLFLSPASAVSIAPPLQSRISPTVFTPTMQEPLSRFERTTLETKRLWKEHLEKVERRKRKWQQRQIHSPLSASDTTNSSSNSFSHSSSYISSNVFPDTEEIAYGGTMASPFQHLAYTTTPDSSKDSEVSSPQGRDVSQKDGSGHSSHVSTPSTVSSADSPQQHSSATSPSQSTSLHDSSDSSSNSRSSSSSPSSKTSASSNSSLSSASTNSASSSSYDNEDQESESPHPEESPLSFVSTGEISQYFVYPPPAYVYEQDAPPDASPPGTPVEDYTPFESGLPPPESPSPTARCGEDFIEPPPMFLPFMGTTSDLSKVEESPEDSEQQQ